MARHESKNCPRCNTPFECKVGNVSECQCSGISFTEQEREYISGTYEDCLCRNCLLAVKRQLIQEPVKEKMDALLKGASGQKTQ